MFSTTSEYVWQKIQPRPRDAHKGTFGSVLAVAGSASYRGAAALAVEGALRTGAGIVTLASVEPVLAAVKNRNDPFLQAVRGVPGVRVLYITRENREGLFRLLERDLAQAE